MATPANRLPVRVARGTYSNLDAAIADLYEGEVCYATDEKLFYVVESAALVAAKADASLEWELSANGTTAYRFSGPGFVGTEDNPTFYLMRGHTYKFNTALSSHPFRIQSTVNGSVGTQYNDGITNNDATSGTLLWEVRFDAPSTLYYQCTSHTSMGGIINILS